MKAQPTAPVPRIALTREEAAAALGVSLSHFERHIAPHLRMVRTGSTRLVPIRELEQWADRAATLAVGSTVPATTKRRGAATTAPGMAHEEQAS